MLSSNHIVGINLVSSGATMFGLFTFEAHTKTWIKIDHEYTFPIIVLLL